MVAQLSGMLGQIYSAFPQASALDLARQVRRPLQVNPGVTAWLIQHVITFIFPSVQMVHIFAGEENHVSNIRSLIEVLTSATLSIFQRGNKAEQHRDVGAQLLQVRPVWSDLLLFAGPREHPDIAESFMHLHAQVGRMFMSAASHSSQKPARPVIYCIVSTPTGSEEEARFVPVWAAGR